MPELLGSKGLQGCYAQQPVPAKQLMGTTHNTLKEGDKSLRRSAPVGLIGVLGRGGQLAGRH